MQSSCARLCVSVLRPNAVVHVARTDVQSAWKRMSLHDGGLVRSVPVVPGRFVSHAYRSLRRRDREIEQDGRTTTRTTDGILALVLGPQHERYRMLLVGSGTATPRAGA